MKTIPLFGLGIQGKSAVVSSQKHVNLYAEIVPEGEKSKIVFHGTPGLILRAGADLGDTPIRGWIAVGVVYYLIHRAVLWEVNNAGTKTSRGTINTSTGRVDMAYDGTTILITTGTNGYTFTVATNTLTQISAAGFPDAARTCAWLDGQFVVDDGVADTFQISADGTNWDALDFATAESAPDGISRVFSDNGEIILFGYDTMEPWGNTGDADFPFAAIKGATQEFGLAARWSLTKFNSGLAALMTSKSGGVQVRFISGYVPTVISSQEMDSIINGYSVVSDATAFSYMLDGHPMLQINFPTAETSWLYDASTGMWTKLEYGGEGARHRGELHLDFINKHLIADYSNGNIYELGFNTYTDNGEPIVREIVGKHLKKDSDPVTIDELFVDMETGVGLATGQGSDPQVMLSVSRNNGRTFGSEMWASLGAIGEYGKRVVWRRLGQSSDWVFKLRVSDPVKVVITYAAIRVR